MIILNIGDFFGTIQSFRAFFVLSALLQNGGVVEEIDKLVVALFVIASISTPIGCFQLDGNTPGDQGSMELADSWIAQVRLFDGPDDPAIKAKGF